MNVWKTIVVASPLVLGLAAGPVMAQAKPRTAGPCRQDIQKLCPDAKGFAAKRDCLAAHSAELSAQCQEHLKKVKAKVDALRTACQDDLQKFCPEAQPGKGALRKCLRQHRSELSQTCKDQLAQVRRHRRHHKAASEAGTNEPAAQ